MSGTGYTLNATEPWVRRPEVDDLADDGEEGRDADPRAHEQHHLGPHPVAASHICGIRCSTALHQVPYYNQWLFLQNRPTISGSCFSKVARVCPRQHLVLREGLRGRA